MRTFDRHHRCRRGLLIMDAVVGLSLVAMLFATLAVVGGQQRRSMRTLEARRVAVRQLEVAAARLQVGDPLRELDSAVTRTPAGDGWTRLSIATANGEVELFVAVAPARESK